MDLKKQIDEIFKVFNTTDLMRIMANLELVFEIFEYWNRDGWISFWDFVFSIKRHKSFLLNFF